jgi:hypothetical protein
MWSFPDARAFTFVFLLTEQGNVYNLDMNFPKFDDN